MGDLSINSHAVYCRERYRNEENFRGSQIQRTLKSRKKRIKEGFVPWNNRPENRGKVKIIQRKYREKLRLEILTHYGGSPPRCACCGTDDVRVLAVDHINNDGAKHRKITGAGTGFYLWLKRNGFPKGFQVLCMNCNWIKRLEGDN